MANVLIIPAPICKIGMDLSTIKLKIMPNSAEVNSRPKTGQLYPLTK